MDKQAFKERMQSLKSYRELNPDKGYWDWKVLAFTPGGTVEEEPEKPNKNPDYKMLQKEFAKETMRQQYLENEGEKAKTNPDLANYWFDFDFEQLNHENPEERKYTLWNYVNRATDARQKEADAQITPFVPEKEIMLRTGRFNTGRISTNVLDSLLASSRRTGVPFTDALGLAGRESGLGYARHHKAKGKLSSTGILSNWLQILPIINTNSMANRFYEILTKYKDNVLVNSEELEFVKKFIENEQREYDQTKPLTESAYDNALRYFKEGKYNPGQEGYDEKVRLEGKMLFDDPAIKKWRKTVGLKNGGVVPAYGDGTKGFMYDYYDPKTVEGILAKTALQVADPTGISSYPDVWYSGKELINNPSWDNTKTFLLNGVSALPLIGKVTAPYKAAKMAKLLARVGDANAVVKTAEKAGDINRMIDTVPEMLPVVKEVAKRTLDLTSRAIVDPLFDFMSTANKMDAVRTYRNLNAAVDVVNTSNTTIDAALGIKNLQEAIYGKWYNNK